MPRCEIRYRHLEVLEMVRGHAAEITTGIARVMSTEDPTGLTLPEYVKLLPTYAPDDINTRDICADVCARALPGRIGRVREIARTIRSIFMTATGGHYSVGVWVVLSEYSTYREYVSTGS